MKTVEQRLYEAFRGSQGISLTAEEVENLMLLDNAILTRISNAMAQEAGVDEPSADCVGNFSLTWNQHVKKMKGFE